MNEILLGKNTDYTSKYEKNILYPISRLASRSKNNISYDLFSGYDVWNCYEFTFLDLKGKPNVYILKIVYDCHSKNMIESKSLKLYLNSFSMTKFENIEIVTDLIKNDLLKVLEAKYINIFYCKFDDKIEYAKIPKKLLIDNINIEINEYNLNPNLLRVINKNKSYKIKLYSNLLKSNCPITGQPDYATIFIEYHSKNLLKKDSLLKYLVSYRQHWEYHENCCENIFKDLYNILNPESLAVKCFFTRRGGIDINPIRFFGIDNDKYFDFHYWRQ